MTALFQGARLAFSIEGPPVAKGRPRFFRVGDTVRTYTPERTARYEDLVALESEHAMSAIGMATAMGPVRVEIVAVFPRPGRLNRRRDPAGRMFMDSRQGGTDIDNIAKAILDGLMRGGVVADDKQVVELLCRKLFAAKGEGPKTEVVMEVLLEVTP